MSKWSDKVKKALRNPRIVRGIAALAGAWMEEHIDQNYGRGKNGERVSHAPLKTVTGRSVSASKPKSVPARAIRRTVVGADGKARTRTFYVIETTSYRAGGQPLVDTGKLVGSLGATGQVVGDNRIELTMHGRKYGLYQDRGFSTKGPNYIPLTKKGRRNHSTGANPNKEGLKRGRDYIVTGSKKRPRGVTVPARPFILPTRDDLRNFGKDIYLGLKSILKGK